MTNNDSTTFQLEQLDSAVYNGTQQSFYSTIDPKYDSSINLATSPPSEDSFIPKEHLNQTISGHENGGDEVEDEDDKSGIVLNGSESTTTPPSCSSENSRKPDRDAFKMFVGQIPKNWNENNCRELLLEYGEIYQLNILRDKDTQQSRGKFFFHCFENLIFYLKFVHFFLSGVVLQFETLSNHLFSCSSSSSSSLFLC